MHSAAATAARQLRGAYARPAAWLQHAWPPLRLIEAGPGGRQVATAGLAERLLPCCLPGPGMAHVTQAGSSTVELLCFGWLLRAIVLLCCQFRLMSGSSRCEFTQLVSSIESQVYGNSSGHEVLWGNCTGLYNEIQSWGGRRAPTAGAVPCGSSRHAIQTTCVTGMRW